VNCISQQEGFKLNLALEPPWGAKGPRDCGQVLHKAEALHVPVTLAGGKAASLPGACEGARARLQSSVLVLFYPF